MADYLHVEKTLNPWDFITIEKCPAPITGHEQKYRIKAGFYIEQKIIEFVISETELESFKRQLEAL